ncbi:MAG: hypothetical protein LBR86_07000 [Tannerella sp.]|jgi:hypothetical protein|nr:hypothetical protein [Tannerella sp.]
MELLEKDRAGEASRQKRERAQQGPEADERTRKDFTALRTPYDIAPVYMPGGGQRVESLQPADRAVHPWCERPGIAAAIPITFTCSHRVINPLKR